MGKSQGSVGNAHSFANGNAPLSGGLGRGLYGEQLNELWTGCSAPGK